MKSNLWGRKREFLLFAIGLAAGYLLFGTRGNSLAPVKEAMAQATAARDAIVWEYRTSSTDVISLQAILTALGADGWEVFSITSVDAILDTGPDGKPHVTSQRLEVTAKRTRRYSAQ